MSNVIDFPNGNNTIENEIYKQNEKYFASIKDRMSEEVKAIERTGHDSINTVHIIADMFNSMIDYVYTVFKNNPNLSSHLHAQEFVAKCMQSMHTILVGGILSPLTGADEEWVDATIPEDVGQYLEVKYRGKEYNIQIESVQVNVRYPKIYRLNNDNRLAHRIDYFQFHDATNPAHVNLTEDSIRFIQFPYTMQSLHCNCIITDNTISDYLNFDYDYVANGLIYPDQNNDDAESYVIAPKIPFYMLEEEGIDVEKEIFDYINEINDSDLDDDIDDFSDDDDDE